MLDATMKQQLGAYLAILRNPIELQVSVNGSDKARELEELAREIAELHQDISVSVTEDEINGRSPVMTVAKAAMATTLGGL